MKSVSFLMYIKMILDWRLLPYRLQEWLFNTTTRAIEVLSGLVLLLFGTMFIANPENIHLIPSYYKFQSVPTSVILSSTGGIGILQLIASTLDSDRSNVISGFLLICSGFIFSLISAAFIASYPPLTSAMTTYPVLAFITLLAGKNQINCAKCKNAK